MGSLLSPGVGDYAYLGNGVVDSDVSEPLLET